MKEIVKWTYEFSKNGTPAAHGEDREDYEKTVKFRTER